LQTYNASACFVRSARTAQPDLRLICIPFAGGSATYFLDWASKTPEGIDLCGVQLPGREDRFGEPLLRDMSTLVRQLADELAQLLDRPFAIFGHSIGALIGFELARQLRREKLPQPVHIIASGLRAPQFISTIPPVAEMPDQDLLQWLRQFSGTPQELLADRNAIECFLTILRADLMLAASYRYEEEPPLQCSLSVYGGLRDASSDRDSLLGWQRHTAGKFRLRMFPGGHFFITGARTAVLQSILADIAESSDQQMRSRTFLG
jgi:medium-chain acyl-[acyl-carrier-protein] hydrolase